MYSKNREINRMINESHSYTFEIDDSIVKYLLKKCSIHKVKYDIILTNIIDIVFDIRNIDLFILLAFKRITKNNNDMLKVVSKSDSEFLDRVKFSNLNVADKERIYTIYRSLDNLSDKFLKE